MNKLSQQIAKSRSVRHDRQRGSALLIVFVFAAVVAITLYKEMPVAVFEAQRQKEEILISRGNEYKRGVKLFVRKIGRFPSSIEELEDTNRMRFLRHRYVDPLTGKDDWRLIHAGPGGVITDSQIAGKSSNAPAAGALGQGATFAGFNNSFTGDTAAVVDAAADAAANPGLRQRPSATKNAGSTDPDGVSLPQGAAELSNAGLGVGTPPVGSPSQASLPPAGLPALDAQPPSDPSTGQAAYSATQTGPNQPGAAVGTALGVGNGIASLSQQLNAVNPQTPQLAQSPQIAGNTALFGSPQTATPGAGNGQLSGAGGIAGVASKASGKSIKTVNDQSKYSKWEFYYDMQKERSGAAANALQNMGANSGNANGANGNNSSTFGQAQPQGQSSFGQTSAPAFNVNGTQPGSQQQPPQQP